MGKRGNIDCTSCRMGSRGVELLFAALKEDDTQMTQLVLTENMVGDKGALALADALRRTARSGFSTLTITTSETKVPGPSLAPSRATPTCRF